MNCMKNAIYLVDLCVPEFIHRKRISLFCNVCIFKLLASNVEREKTGMELVCIANARQPDLVNLLRASKGACGNEHTKV